MKHKKLFGMKSEYLVAVLVLTAAFGVMAKVAPLRSKRAKTVKPVASVVVPKVRRTLDGVLVERGKGKENTAIAGVMVENMIEAQPISGIADASLVFEAVAEANITRFLAYFILDAGQPSFVIGPVRSARPYYLDWAAEFNTLYAHVGSAPAAYEMLRKKGVPGVYDLDQWYESQYYSRVANHPAPHNVYTSTEFLKRAYDAQHLLPKFQSWRFKNDAPPDLRGTVADIRVGYSAPYDVGWKYDKAANQYGRFQWTRPSASGGSVGQVGPHKDAKGKAIAAKNIAVAFQKMEVLDAIGRKKFTTIGEGKAFVFQDGRVVTGVWKKPSAQERMRFYNAQDSEVEFNAGTTWIEIVPAL